MAWTFTATHAAIANPFIMHGGTVSGTIVWGYGAAPTAGALTVTDGSNTLLQIGGVSVAGVFQTPFKYTAPADPRATATFSVTLTFTVADGGAAIVGSLNFIRD